MTQAPDTVELSEWARESLREDDEFILYRARDSATNLPSVLLLTLASTRPRPESLKKIEHEYSLRHDLDAAWAVRPLALSENNGLKTLVLEDPGGEFLHRLIQGPMEIQQFLRIAIGLASALGHLHRRSVIHKDVKPSNILVDAATGRVWLMGFGIASRLPRERQSHRPPEFIAGTLPYMAPEQTGRMNRSIDTRSDLYALGVTLYEMLTGTLPFTATDPMDWVHCHIARQPEAPDVQRNGVPPMLSAMIMKLLAKTAEERYQTAVGLERDLRVCLDQWETRHQIDGFPLASHDIPDRLVIPEKLYGREREIDVLLAAFDNIVGGGRPEFVLVSGYSGIGKSAVIHELQRQIVPSRGLFATAKFDQFRRNVPYATLAQAFQSLLRQVLSKSESELGKWRYALREAIDPNGQLIADLLPELKLIIGEQPPVPEVSPKDTQARFQQVFARFICVFTRQEHPLTLFLDDLQWVDAATLDLISDLLTRPDVRHLLLIGAYRENDVDPAHPLIRKLEALRAAGVTPQDIVLAPLTRENLAQFIADSVHGEPEQVAPLAELVHQKTGGNPFFAIQFISALAEEGLLTFDHTKARWIWRLDHIRARRYTDNVVDFLVGKLTQLPAATQEALQQLACFGNSAELSLLRLISHDSTEEMHSRLWEAVRAGFVYQSEDSYRFLHDRVQEAAYSLIPEQSRAETHLRIGRILAEKIPRDERDERIFEIVNQFNRATHLITSDEERKRVAEFNLIAARRAKLSTAYAWALTHLETGRNLLRKQDWDSNYELIFSLECLTAECELLIADTKSAELRLSMLVSHVSNAHDLAVITRLQLILFTVLQRLDRGVEVCLSYLQHCGTNWPAHPTGDEVRREYDRMESLLAGRQIEYLLDLPAIVDQEILDLLEVLTEFLTTAVFFDKDLCTLVICRLVNLSLEHGSSDAACISYVWFGFIAGPRFGDHETASRFGQLGYDLVEKRGLKRYEARARMCFGSFVIPWRSHARHGRDIMLRAFDVAYRMGDFTYAAYSFTMLAANSLFVGDSLADVQTEAQKGIDFARSVGVGLVVDLIESELRLIRNLRGLTNEFGFLNDKEFDETRFEQYLARNSALAAASFKYWTQKTEARFLAGEFVSAADASLKAHELLWAAPPLLEIAPLRFYGALSHAAAWDLASPAGKETHFQALEDHYKELELWAKLCPANFENAAVLVAAEMARIENRFLDAETLYEKAIRSAHANGFIHQEAVACEVSGRFYAGRGLEMVAAAYLQNARYCYVRWGADGKVKQLDRSYPHLRKEPSSNGLTSTLVAAVESLDLATVIKVSQTVSAEMVLEKLLDNLMRAAVEHAGAERGLLIVPEEVELQIEAEAVTTGDHVTVRLRDASHIAPELPKSLVRYVARTRKDVVLEDASTGNPFSPDPYIVQHRARSILCLPLISQSKLTAVLYLENNLAPCAFTPDRVTVLKLLASQAAISLENTRLYRDLENREAKIRRLVDANILAVAMWDLEGAIVGANDAFLRMVEYTREEIESGCVRWSDITPAEWHRRDKRAFAQLKRTGIVEPYEKELYRKDRSRVPVLIAGALFEDGSNEGVAFALNLSEQKRAEAEIAVQNIRLQLLLKLTNHVNSNLQLRQVLRAVSANIREVMQCEAVLISLREPGTEKFRLHAVDFPEGRGFVKEEMLVDPVGAAKRALETLEPAVRSTNNPDEFPPNLFKVMVSEGLQHQCVIPLVSRDRVVGLLAINRRTDIFLQDEIDFLREASGQIAIAIENCLAYREISDLKEKLAQEKLYLEAEIRSDLGFDQIVGNSPALKRVLQLVETVAPSDSTVLLLGETGTGKELIARAVHDRSRRNNRTFVKLNCAAIPTGLLESELFGHEKGAFTGAISQKIGRLELADQGTLFLDEIGDIPPEIQPKLLRALQEREFERLGSTRTRKVDIRLIAATNRDLEKMVDAREFRSDLYYRLNVFPIRIPPLRERSQDIPLLVSYFTQKFSRKMQKQIDNIPVALMKALTAWKWPGNVRELENFIERAVILTSGGSLTAPLAELNKVSAAETGSAASANRDDIAKIVRETIDTLRRNDSANGDRVKKQRDEMVRALTEAKGRVGGTDGAAARLRLNRTTLLARMKKLGIDPRDYAL